MKKLQFTYDMQIEYSTVVSRCNFTIKCMPKDTRRQKMGKLKFDLFPDTKYQMGMDGLQNQQIYGANNEAHQFFRFHLEGEAVTGLCDYEEEADENLTMIFGHPHGLNAAGETIKTFFQQIEIKKNQKNYDTAVLYMQALYQKFTYQSCTTNVDTSAEEAFRQGKGVCQDYAHILIALLHLAHIPARYVTGFIIGEGQSHAWVEILDDWKWYGIDPTHAKAVNDDYIKIGIGRDAKDCMINRGIMQGGGLHTQTVQVRVREK